MIWYAFISMRRNSRLDLLYSFTQHGDTSCLLHSIAVAHYSVKLAEFLHIKYNRKELIRGALLHDYFLYDWHEKDNTHSLHGFTHPAAAYENAKQDFSLSVREGDIILSHMFPLTLRPPKYKESCIVCFVDKICSIYETFARNTYSSIRKRLVNIEK